MKTHQRDQLWIAVIGALLFVPFLGGVRLFEWDEINFAEVAREMIVLGDYFRVHMDFKPFWEKPPLFFWLQAFSMKIWGVGEFAARFPNAVCGIVSLLFLYNIGRYLHSALFGRLWALAYAGSTLPFLYFKSGIIDPWFNLFIFAGLYGAIRFYWGMRLEPGQKQKAYFWLIVGAASVGLGVLTKGPVAYLLICLTFGVYWIYKRLHFYIKPHEFLIFSLVVILVPAIWFGLEILKNGTWFIEEFTRYQIRLLSTEDAGHGGFPGYHFVVVLIGCFPASIFAIHSLFPPKDKVSAKQKDFRLWMVMLLGVVLILFSLVQSKIVHYSSLSYFPLTYLAAVFLYKWIKKEEVMPSWMKGMLIGVAGLYVLVTGIVSWLGQRLDLIKPLIKGDPFALENLSAQPQWGGWEFIASLWLLIVGGIVIYLIRRKDISKSIYVLFLGNALFIFLGLICFIGKVEEHSQAAAMRFYESLQEEECYVSTRGFKSYGEHFYTRKMPGGDERRQNEEWLLTGDIDRDAYFVVKINKIHTINGFPGVEEIGRENGFVFYRRKRAELIDNFAVAERSK